jgi:hypothetical protein
MKGHLCSQQQYKENFISEFWLYATQIVDLISKQELDG